MTPYETGSLWAQWVGSVSGALAVVVAAVFGYLTLANNRRSKDAQQRAAIAAASDGSAPPQSVIGARSGQVSFSVRGKSGETWLLLNEGPDVAHTVQIDGLTDLDKRRLREDPLGPTSLRAGEAKEFVLVSRFTLSGPANIVVSFRLEPDGSLARRVLEVPGA